MPNNELKPEDIGLTLEGIAEIQENFDRTATVPVDFNPCVLEKLFMHNWAPRNPRDIQEYLSNPKIRPYLELIFD